MNHFLPWVWWKHIVGQIEDLKRLCKIGSRTPGHPENVTTDGIEVTTGMFKLPILDAMLIHMWMMDIILQILLKKTFYFLPTLETITSVALWRDTVGPLGQGVANAVGLAVAEKHLAARFNKPDSIIVDHRTYVSNHLSFFGFLYILLPYFYATCEDDLNPRPQPRSQG